MAIVPIILVVGIVILVMYFLLNKKDVETEREGLVRDILSKDAIAVDFDEGKNTIVKFFGITLAAENEMLDDKINAFSDEHLRGVRVSVKPRRVGAGDIVLGEVRTSSGEYVNAVLVRHGFARWSVTEASGDADLAAAQDKAKSEQLGVWNPAVRQLVEERMKQQSAGEEVSDDDIANMQVDPDQEQSKEEK